VTQSLSVLPLDSSTDDGPLEDAVALLALSLSLLPLSTDLTKQRVCQKWYEGKKRQKKDKRTFFNQLTEKIFGEATNNIDSQIILSWSVSTEFADELQTANQE
jgi:hypothetical protein